MDAVVREIMDITDEMAATDAKNVKAMWTIKSAGSPRRRARSSTSARNTSRSSTHPRATPSARSSG
eukprot:1246072-Pleurochrysis_carterae.AAC.1